MEQLENKKILLLHSRYEQQVGIKLPNLALVQVVASMQWMSPAFYILIQ